MGLIDLAFDGSGNKGARINMEALLRQDLDPQPPPRQNQMGKNKAKDRETVRSRQSRVHVPKPTRKTPLLKKNEELLAGSSAKPPPRGPPVVPPTKRATKYQPPKNAPSKTQNLSNSSSLKTLASTSSASQAAQGHPQIPKFKNTKTVVKGKRPPQIETNSTSEQKYVTISETQLSQILNLVSQGIQVQQGALQVPTQVAQQQAAQQPVPVEQQQPQPVQPQPVEPVQAPVIDEPKVETRDEILEKSQKAVPLSMKSSFLPYEAVPRGDAVQKERREQQLAWRRELEKQRDEDALRKKKEKEEYARQEKHDHHLTAQTQPDYKSSIKIFNQNSATNSATESVANSVENISPRTGTQPLTMQSSFHPSGNVPNTDNVEQQRRDQQLAWRRELDKQRQEDAARKNQAKKKDQDLKLIDHHLYHQGDNSYQKPSIKLIQDNPNHQDHISSLASYQSQPVALEQLHGTHVAETGHHRNMNALKDPAELERLEKQRKQQQENERDLQRQIESNKKKKAASQEDDDEPWWAKQDRRNAENRKKQQTARSVAIPQQQQQKPAQPLVTVEVLHSAFDPSKINLKEEPTVAPLKLEDLNSRRSPSPVRQTAKATKAAPRTLLDEQIPTDTELKAQERNLAKKKRQMALLEEQLKVEERLRTMRIKKEADKPVRTTRESKERFSIKNISIFVVGEGHRKNPTKNPPKNPPSPTKSWWVADPR